MFPEPAACAELTDPCPNHWTGSLFPAKHIDAHDKCRQQKGCSRCLVERCQNICETIVDTGIKAMDSATNYATISIVSPASEGKKEKSEAAGAAASALTMAAIFLVVAILIVAVCELGIAYKAHEAAKQEEEKKN